MLAQWFKRQHLDKEDSGSAGSNDDVTARVSLVPETGVTGDDIEVGYRAELLTRWLALSETQRRALQALSREVGVVSDPIESRNGSCHEAPLSRYRTSCRAWPDLP